MENLPRHHSQARRRSSDPTPRVSAPSRRQRKVSVIPVAICPSSDARNSWFSLELLYNVTDVVLIICAAIVILSCIAHLALWGYGFGHAKRSGLEEVGMPLP